MAEISTGPRPRVIITVCTYHRNEPLDVLLTACIDIAKQLQPSTSIGVVIVDDSQDRKAEVVANKFKSLFELGLYYFSSKSGNISIARNIAIENAAKYGDWIAMTDDDCEPSSNWLASLIETQSKTGCDIATGLMLRRPGAAAPSWLIDQNFLSLGESPFNDGEEMSVAFTNNCLISSKWINGTSDLRFDPSLGITGGEDMVFFKLAKRKGMKICFSKSAIVYENEPAERLTFRYQVRRYFWHGNSSYVTQRKDGVSYGRLLVHGGMSLIRSASYSPGRILKGQSPNLRLYIALLAEAAGKISGSLGARIKHH